MPKAMHDALARTARKKGLTGERFNAYVYGTMQRAKKKDTLEDALVKQKRGK